MTVAAITGHSKLYRDLYVRIGRTDLEMESLEWNDDDTISNLECTPEQAKVIGAFGSGDFVIKVAEDGTTTVEITA